MKHCVIKNRFQIYNLISIFEFLDTYLIYYSGLKFSVVFCFQQLSGKKDIDTELTRTGIFQYP